MRALGSRDLRRSRAGRAFHAFWNPTRPPRLVFRGNWKEEGMATNKPVGDNARKGAVRKRTQLRSKIMGESTWTKRDKTTGKFVDQKKAPAKKKFKGVRREKAG